MSEVLSGSHETQERATDTSEQPARDDEGASRIKNQSRTRARVHSGALGVLSLTTVLALWWGLAAFHVVSDIFLPAPPKVFAAGVSIIAHGYQGVSLLADFEASMLRVVVGLVAGVLVGVPLGLAMGYSPRIRAVFNPLIQLFRPLPPLAYLTLLIIWFGIGDVARVVLLYLAALPVLTIGAMQGASSVPQEKRDVARALGATRFQVFRYVIFPGARADVLTSLRVATGVVFTTLVAAEMIGANVGLGAMDLNASRYFQSDIILFSIIVLGLAGVLLDLVVVGLDRWLVPWRGKV